MELIFRRLLSRLSTFSLFTTHGRAPPRRRARPACRRRSCGGPGRGRRPRRRRRRARGGARERESSSSPSRFFFSDARSIKSGLFFFFGLLFLDSALGGSLGIEVGMRSSDELLGRWGGLSCRRRGMERSFEAQERRKEESESESGGGREREELRKRK